MEVFIFINMRENNYVSSHAVVAKFRENETPCAGLDGTRNNDRLRGAHELFAVVDDNHGSVRKIANGLMIVFSALD